MIKYMTSVLIPLSISSQRASCDPASASPPFASTIEALELVRSLLWLFLLEANELDVRHERPTIRVHRLGLHTTPLFRGRQGRATDKTPY